MSRYGHEFVITGITPEDFIKRHCPKSKDLQKGPKKNLGGTSKRNNEYTLRGITPEEFLFGLPSEKKGEKISNDPVKEDIGGTSKMSNLNEFTNRYQYDEDNLLKKAEMKLGETQLEAAVEEKLGPLKAEPKEEKTTSKYDSDDEPSQDLMALASYEK
uniref:Uncharacterized protein n=1 Tax=Clastoptera arizonana TaxID=38151 RepID=A0A1B6DJE1_9HEMI